MIQIESLIKYTQFEQKKNDKSRKLSHPNISMVYLALYLKSIYVIIDIQDTMSTIRYTINNENNKEMQTILGGNTR